MSALYIELFSPAQLDDWLSFFDGDAFADNPEWGGCYCRCYLFGGCGGRKAWQDACETGANRQVMLEAIKAAQVDGLLAKRDDSVVGWVHFGPSGRFCSPLGPLEPVEPGLATIVCFVVAALHRRTGVARALLQAACDELARQGFVAVEARPQVDATRKAPDQYSGPLSLYLAEGFEVVERSGSAARVVRRLDGPN